MTGEEQRRASRKRVLKGALIAFNNRGSTMSCTVRDLSDTGARLRIARGQMVPSNFDLIIDSEGIDVPCTVAWRKGEEIGAAFDRPPERKSPLRTITPITKDGTPSLLRKPVK